MNVNKSLYIPQILLLDFFTFTFKQSNNNRIQLLAFIINYRKWTLIFNNSQNHVAIYYYYSIYSIIQPTYNYTQS